MKYQFIENFTYFITYKLAKACQPVVSFDDTIKEIIKKRILTNEKFQIDIIAYAILSDHLHLLIDFIDQAMAKEYLKQLAGGSSFEMNKYLNKKGNNWEKYFPKAIPNEKAYYNVIGYILGNPIRHGLVNSFEELFDYNYTNFSQFCDEENREFVENVILNVLKIKDNDVEERFYQSFT
jgi:REP element-mobilizing transposase RayT